MDRRNGSISHRAFKDILDYVNPGDLMVVNDTRVIPARLLGRRETGGKVEVLLLKEVGHDLWECLVKPGHKTRIGDKLYFGDEGTKALGDGCLPGNRYGGRGCVLGFTTANEDVIGVLGPTLGVCLLT